MKLTDIDLTDKEEVAAAHALLAAILGNAVSGDIPGAPSLTQTITERVGDVSRTVTVTPARVPVAPPPGDRDPAAVFGAQSATPLPSAPSTAAVDQLPTAPVALPGSLPGMVVSPPPAPTIAPVVHAQNQAAVAGLTSPAGNVELDSEGLPWDARIHAGSKSKTAKGVWTAKRGVGDDPSVNVEQIKAELRAHAGQSAAPLPVTPLPGMPAQSAQLTASPALTALPTGAAGAAFSTMMAAQTTDPATFEQLMPRVTQAAVSGLIPPTALQDTCVAAGLPNVVALQTNPAYVPHIWAHLKANFPALQ